MSKSFPTKIFHFHNGTGGGVLSVIRNLLAFRQHSEIENHVIYTINLDHTENYKTPRLDGATSEQIFYYSPKWNFYYTCRKLAKLLPNDKVIIVAHDWLELGMVSNLGLQNPVVHYVHGAYDYYYSLATKHKPWIDCYITVSQHIADELIFLMPERRQNIHYLRFAVPEIKYKMNEKYPGFHIIFAGRCEESKGYLILPEIEKSLKKSAIKAQWHIAGEGSEMKDRQQIWPPESSVHFYGNLEHALLMQLFCHTHVLVHPSEAEGMPVVVIEAMKAGLVPLVNDLLACNKELIIDGISGFLVQNNQVEQYAYYIKTLITNQTQRKYLSYSAQKFALEHFNPSVNTKFIEKLFLKIKIATIVKKKQKLYGSRLDHPMVCNFLTYFLRTKLW